VLECELDSSVRSEFLRALTMLMFIWIVISSYTLMVSQPRMASTWIHMVQNREWWGALMNLIIS
jgi:hypothetical protein